jgi:hypothetical protein
VHKRHRAPSGVTLLSFRTASTNPPEMSSSACIHPSLVQQSRSICDSVSLSLFSSCNCIRMVRALWVTQLWRIHSLMLLTDNSCARMPPMDPRPSSRPADKLPHGRRSAGGNLQLGLKRRRRLDCAASTGVILHRSLMTGLAMMQVCTVL